MKRHLNISIITLFFLMQSAIAQQQPPEGGKPKDFKLPHKEENQLPNGFRSTFVQYGNIPKVTISLIIKTGNIHEDSNQVWLADLTGEFLKQGTSTMNFKSLSDTVAAMGGEISVTVRPDQTTISGAVLSDYAADFIGLLAKVAMSPAFPESELIRIKANLKRQLAIQKSVPQSQAEEAFGKAVYPNSPYGRLFPSEEMIDGFTLTEVKKFYENNFGAKRSVLYAVGQFDNQELKQAIRKAFESWKPGPEVQYPEEVAVAHPDTIIIDRKGAPQTTIIIGLPTIGPQHENYVQQIITNSLLGGSFGSRIMKNIREDKGYAYSPYSNVVNTKGGTVWKEVADVTSKYTIASLNEIETEIKRLQEVPPTADELKGIQNYEAGTFVLRNSLPQGIIAQLNFLDLYSLPDTYLTNMVKNIHAVTPEQVSAIARDYYLVNKMTVVMVGDREEIEKQMGK